MSQNKKKEILSTNAGTFTQANKKNAVLGYRKNKAIAQVDFQKSETKKISSCSPNSSPGEISEK